MKPIHAFLQFVFLLTSAVGSSSEPQGLSRPYDAEHYSIRLKFDPRTDGNTFEATAEIRIKATSSLNQIELDANELKPTAVELLVPQKRKLDFQVTPEQLTLLLPKPVRRHQTLVVSIHYVGRIQQRHHGFFRVQDPGDPSRGSLFFTQFEPNGARLFYPCNDNPADKATTEVRTLLPEGYEAISNGRRASQKRVRENQQTWLETLWRMDVPHSTYLVSLAIGKFATKAKKFKSTPVSVWVGKQDLGQVDYALDATIRSLKFLSEYLSTPYPWAKYATVGIPTFFWGGMENTSATHMNQERILLSDPKGESEMRKIYSLVAHEAAHQWFGDLVTMKWWDDLWLNEAFASYLATAAVADRFGKTESELLSLLELWDEYFRQDNGPRSRALVSNAKGNPEDDFDAIAYTKGEAVLRLLAHEVGETNFRKGLASYLKTFRYRNTTYIDFFASLEKASGKSLERFRDSWLLHRGYPTIRYRSEWNGETRKLKLSVAQKNSHPNERGRFVFTLPIALHRKKSPEFHHTFTVEMGESEATTELELPAEPEWISVNAGAYVLAEVLPPEGQDTALRQQAAFDPDPSIRVWAARQLMAPIAHGAAITKSSEDSIANILLHDSSPYVRMAVISLLQKLPARWLEGAIAKASTTLALTSVMKDSAHSPPASSDIHGWQQWQAKRWALLGKIESETARQILAENVIKPDLSLEEVTEITRAIALRGEKESLDLLERAAAVHNKRGYRFQFAVEYAYGSLERPEAAQHIKRLATSSRPDLLGRISRVIRDNTTLKRSEEWAAAVEELILKNDKLDLDVKVLLLSTIEDVKTNYVHKVIQRISTSQVDTRILEASKKILGKNFS